MNFEKAIGAYYDALFSGDYLGAAKIWKQMQVEDLEVSGYGTEIEISISHQGDLNFDYGAGGSEVEIHGYSWGDVNYQPYSDGSSYSSWGIGGRLTINDAWETDTQTGFVGQGVKVTYTQGADLNIGWTPSFVAYNSGYIDASFDSVDHVDWSNVDGSSLETFFLGDGSFVGDDLQIDAFFADSVSFDGNNIDASFVILEEGESTGNNITVDVGTLTESYDINGGYGQTLSVGNADGAQITIGSPQQDDGFDPLCELLGICEEPNQNSATADTFVFVAGGDVSVNDFGQSSSIRLGDGNDSANLQGEDTFLNMGDGFDFLTSSANGAIVSGAEWVNHQGGDLILLDIPVGGYTQLGGQTVDINRGVSVFGENIDGHAVLETDFGDLTFANAADQLLPQWDMVA